MECITFLKKASIDVCSRKKVKNNFLNWLGSSNKGGLSLALEVMHGRALELSIYTMLFQLCFSVRYNHQNYCARGSSFLFSVFSAVNQLLQIPQSRLVSECALQPSSQEGAPHSGPVMPQPAPSMSTLWECTNCLVGQQTMKLDFSLQLLFRITTTYGDSNFSPVI